jgi:hypothetical protein
MAPGRAFRLVQPWGADPGREATVSEHTTSVDAFVALDALAEGVSADRYGGRFDRVVLGQRCRQRRRTATARRTLNRGRSAS